jgi:Rieske [2Fe-2S] domain
MSELPRVDRLLTRPVPGLSYLVPTVRGSFHAKIADWPVMGHLHEDARFFSFVEQHYHVDPRFVSVRFAKRVFSAPLHARDYAPLGKIVFRQRKCIRTMPDYPFSWRPEIDAVQRTYAGQQCARGKGGWICPHQKAALGSIPPNANGVITCPLHGLRINAASGVVEAA